MRWPIILFIIGAFMGNPSRGFAQSQYWYPWCSIYSTGFGSSGHRSCYFTSWEQCLATMSGLGGLCIENPSSPPIAPHPAPYGKKADTNPIAADAPSFIAGGGTGGGKWTGRWLNAMGSMSSGSAFWRFAAGASRSAIPPTGGHHRLYHLA
jgi:Protein of unknown function (DUF3551)